MKVSVVPVADLTTAVGLTVMVPEWSQVDRLGAYESLELWAVNGEVDLPRHKVLRADMLGIRRKLTANGFAIQLPETPDGRHADFAPTVVMALRMAFADPPEQVKPGPSFGSKEWGAMEEDRMREAAMNPPPERDEWEEAGY